MLVIPGGSRICPANSDLTATPMPGSTNATFTPAPNWVATIVANRQPETINTVLSPDGKWKAEVVRWECIQVGDAEQAYEELQLIQVNDGAEQVVDTQLQTCGGVGAYGLGIQLWSANSRYLYYTPAREGRPDGSCWYWYRPLVALEVETGQKTPLREGPQSANLSMLAFWEGDDLVVWSFATGETQRIPKALPGLQPGPITWAADSQALAYIQNGSGDCSFGKSALVRVDLPTGQPSVLLESEAPSFTQAELGSSQPVPPDGCRSEEVDL